MLIVTGVDIVSSDVEQAGFDKFENMRVLGRLARLTRGLPGSGRRRAGRRGRCGNARSRRRVDARRTSLNNNNRDGERTLTCATEMLSRSDGKASMKEGNWSVGGRFAGRKSDRRRMLAGREMLRRERASWYLIACTGIDKRKKYGLCDESEASCMTRKEAQRTCRPTYSRPCS